MDTCFLLTEIESARCDAALTKVRGFLKQYRHSETRYSSKDDLESQQKAMAEHEANWAEYLRTGVVPAKTDESNPYDWMRFGGFFDLADREHIIHFFLFPVTSNTAAVAVGFWSTVYDVIYSERSPFDGVIDRAARQDFIDLLLLIAVAFSPEAFALKSLIGVDDYGLRLRVADVQNWLLGVTPAESLQWRFQLAGIRKDLIDRARLDARGIGPTLSETSSGYIVRSLIGVV